MSRNPFRISPFGGALIALAVVAPAAGAATSDDAASKPAPVVVAQASTPPAVEGSPVAVTSKFPAYQRGVRQAAAESNQALRRYVWRTRMIYNYYYYDFATKE
jgi:hypothetical protein